MPDLNDLALGDCPLCSGRGTVRVRRLDRGDRPPPGLREVEPDVFEGRCPDCRGSGVVARTLAPDETASES